MMSNKRTQKIIVDELKTIIENLNKNKNKIELYKNNDDKKNMYQYLLKLRFCLVRRIFQLLIELIILNEKEDPI